jgi:hypothetical protein
MGLDLTPLRHTSCTQQEFKELLCLYILRESEGSEGVEEGIRQREREIVRE